MILVDTSIWVDHLRRSTADLADALAQGVVGSHPFVIGELALGHLRRRHEILSLVNTLPRVPMAEHEDVLRFVEIHDLAGSGVGWVDAHLLCAARVAGWRLWSADRRLAHLAARLARA